MDDKLREALATGRELYNKKEYVRAEPYLTQLSAEKVPYADVYNMLGVIHHDGGQFSKAQECFEEALRINPSYTEASLNLAVTYNDMGRYHEAKDIYLSALTSSSVAGGKLDSFVMGKLANMYADIAEVYLSAGAYEEAIAELRRALTLRPTFIDIRLKLAQALRDSGEPGDAQRELKTVLGQNPEYTPARIHLGITLFSLGETDESIQELESVLAEDAGNKRAQLYLDMIRSHKERQSHDGGPDAGEDKE
jgi:tetratricopeptide (TPR) repeat protein